MEDELRCSIVVVAAAPEPRRRCDDCLQALQGWLRRFIDEEQPPPPELHSDCHLP